MDWVDEIPHSCCAWCAGLEHVDVVYVNPEATFDDLAASLAASARLELLELVPAPEAPRSPFGDVDWDPWRIRWRPIPAAVC